MSFNQINMGQQANQTFYPNTETAPDALFGHTNRKENSENRIVQRIPQDTSSLKNSDEKGKQFEDSEIIDEDAAIDKSMTSCKICHRQIFKDQLEFHMEVRHPKRDRAFVRKYGKYQAKANENNQSDTASTSASANSSTTTHTTQVLKKRRERNYTHQGVECPMCLKSFCSKHSLERHITMLHSNKTRLTCYFCGMQYNREEDIYRHLKVKHLKEEIKKKVRVPCSICFKIFKGNQNLQRHLWFVHQGVQSFQCNICDRRFFQLGHANRHLRRVHLKEKKVKAAL